MIKQFRSRPIDINRILNVFHGDLPEDEIDEIYDPNDRILTEMEIPIPDIKEDESKVVDHGERGDSSFVRPNTYIRFFESWQFEKDQILYDMDDRDFDFIKKHNIPGNDMESLIDLFEKETAFSDELIDFQSLGSLSNPYARTVFQYWKERRLSRCGRYYPRCGKPLLNHFELPPDPNDENPLGVFRPREDRPLKRKKNEPEHGAQMEQLKNDFVQLLSVMECIKERERINQELTEAKIQFIKRHDQPHDVLLTEFIIHCRNIGKPVFAFLLPISGNTRFGRNGRIYKD